MTFQPTSWSLARNNLVVAKGTKEQMEAMKKRHEAHPQTYLGGFLGVQRVKPKWSVWWTNTPIGEELPTWATKKKRK